MEGNIRSCNQASNDYMNFLSGNYLSNENMYQDMIQSDLVKDKQVEYEKVKEEYPVYEKKYQDYDEEGLDTVRENDEEEIMEEECAYLKMMYPKMCQPILKVIEDECDKLEYAGSVMFDEYPDRIMLERLTKKVYDKIETPVQDEPVEINECCRNRGYRRNRCYDCYEDGNPNWLYTVVKAMFYNELLHRRRRYRYRRYRR